MQKKKRPFGPPNPTPAPPHPKLSNYEGCIKVAAFIIGELRNLDDKNNNQIIIHIITMFPYMVPMVFL